MTTHIIINAVTDVKRLVERFRDSQHSKLVLQLGQYVTTEERGYRFIPGIDKRNFELLWWLLSRFGDWKTKEKQKWRQDIEFYWTDPHLLSQIKAEKTEKKASKHLANKGMAIPLGPAKTDVAAPLLPLVPELELFPQAYIKGVVHHETEEDMEYEENGGQQEEHSDLFCAERPYSFQVKLKTDRPLHPSLAERVHLHNVSHISIKRHYVFNYEHCYAYRFTIAKTGETSKHEVCASGVLTYHVSIELFRNQTLLDTKNNLTLAGDLCEKGLDLLGKETPYSLFVFSPQSPCNEIYEMIRNRLLEYEFDENEVVVPTNIIRFLW